MKILHVLLSPRAEGTPRLVLDWLTVKDYEQELLFLSDDGELKDTFQQQPNWQFYNTSFEPRFKSIFKIINLVKQKASERKPDIVISWVMGFSPWILMGAKHAGVKKLIVHGGNPPGDTFIGKYIFSYMSFWIGNALNSTVICCSAYIRDAFRKIPLLSDEQFQAVYNCFKPQKFQLPSPPQRQSNLAIMVATFEPHKDHITLLKAWKIIEGKGLNYKLMLAGNGGLYEHLTDYAKKQGLNNVEFLGSRKDIPELLHQSSLFVFSTTHQEGFGTVLIEALASGCKVVATDVPACREVLQDGKFGLLVPTKNADALADAVIKCLGTPIAETEKKSQSAYANQFTPERMIEAYIKIVNND